MIYMRNITRFKSNAQINNVHINFILDFFQLIPSNSNVQLNEARKTHLLNSNKWHVFSL